MKEALCWTAIFVTLAACVMVAGAGFLSACVSFFAYMAALALAGRLVEFSLMKDN